MSIYLFFAIAICVIIIVRIIGSDKPSAGTYIKQHTEEVYGDIQFKGKVLKVHRIFRDGRLYGIMCIKLDYTNTDNFYRFNETCLKIENGIVALPTNSLSNDVVKSDKRVNATLNAVYVEVNMKNNRQMVFIDSIGNKFAQDLDYQNSGLKESDLGLCDDCE